jgi:hypothetical protein
MPSEPAHLETDEDIQKLLAGGPVKAPRTFRGRELAKYASGLRDLVMKVVRPQDTGIFHDVVLIYVLSEANGTTPEDRLARRRAMISATDDVETFRAHVSLELLDTLEDEEVLQMRGLVDEILKPAQAAQVSVVTEVGKKNGAAKAKPSRTKTRS